MTRRETDTSFKGKVVDKIVKIGYTTVLISFTDGSSFEVELDGAYTGDSILTTYSFIV